MSLSSFGDVVKSRIRRTPQYRELLSSQVVGEVRQWIKEQWGQAAFEDVRVLYVRDGIVFVGVSSASFAHAMRLSEQNLLVRLQRVGSRLKVRAVRVFVGEPSRATMES